MTEVSLESWLQRLESAHPTEIDLGLDRVAKVAEDLDLLAPAVPVITVAGTNGKGSTIAVMEAALLAAGKRPGAYTSPHFIAFNERIRLAGQEATDSDIVAAFDAIEAARGKVSLTYFEFATLAALWLFKEHQVEAILLEVGLGGRLDAANIIDADVAVITSIGLDHQDWLGDTLGEIAVEKAGIIRRGRPVVLADANVLTLLLAHVQAVGALPDDLSDFEGLPASAPGGLVPRNVMAARAALAHAGLPCDDAEFARGLARINLTGRRQRRCVGGKEYILDVAHNPDAIASLMAYLAASDCKGKTICLFSVMADKDIEAMVTACSGHFTAWFLAALPDVNRAAEPADVAAVLHAAGNHMISVSKNVRQAFRRAQSLMAEGDRLVVCGSFYTVAGVIPLLDKDQRKLES